MLPATRVLCFLHRLLPAKKKNVMFNLNLPQKFPQLSKKIIVYPSALSYSLDTNGYWLQNFVILTKIIYDLWWPFRCRSTLPSPALSFLGFILFVLEPRPRTSVKPSRHENTQLFGLREIFQEIALSQRKWPRLLKESFQRKIYLAVGRYENRHNPNKIKRFHFCWLTNNYLNWNVYR